MATNDKVTVVIPCYNSEAYLSQAIDSVFAQTHANIEVIFVDDGSTDRTAEIARSYDQVHYIYQENAGQAAALNNGFRLAKGDYLSSIDSDDVWMPDKLELQLAAFAENPELDVVYGHIEEFIEPGTQQSVITMAEKRKSVVPAHLPCAMLMKPSAFLRAGNFDETLKISSVIDFYSRVVDAGLNTLTLDDIVYRRRIHGKNITITHKAELQAEYLTGIKAALARRRSANAKKPE